MFFNESFDQTLSLMLKDSNPNYKKIAYLLGSLPEDLLVGVRVNFLFDESFWYQSRGNDGFYYGVSYNSDMDELEIVSAYDEYFDNQKSSLVLCSSESLINDLNIFDNLVTKLDDFSFIIGGFYDNENLFNDYEYHLKKYDDSYVVTTFTRERDSEALVNNNFYVVNMDDVKEKIKSKK